MLTRVWQTLIDVTLTSESTIAVQTFTLKPVHRAGSNVELDITDAMLELETTIHHNIHAQLCTHSLLQCRVRYFRPGIFNFYFMLLFLSEKNQNLLDIQEHCICKMGKIPSELELFCFLGVFKSCIPGSFDTVTSLSMGFCRERAVAGQGPSGLRFFRHKHSASAISYLLVVADVVVVFPTLQSEEIPLLQKM